LPQSLEQAENKLYGKRIFEKFTSNPTVNVKTTFLLPVIPSGHIHLNRDRIEDFYRILGVTAPELKNGVNIVLPSRDVFAKYREEKIVNKILEEIEDRVDPDKLNTDEYNAQAQNVANEMQKKLKHEAYLLIQAVNNIDHTKQPWPVLAPKDPFYITHPKPGWPGILKKLGWEIVGFTPARIISYFFKLPASIILGATGAVFATFINLALKLIRVNKGIPRKAIFYILKTPFELIWSPTIIVSNCLGITDFCLNIPDTIDNLYNKLLTRINPRRRGKKRRVNPRRRSAKKPLGETIGRRDEYLWKELREVFN